MGARELATVALVDRLNDDAVAGAQLPDVVAPARGRLLDRRAAARAGRQKAFEALSVPPDERLDIVASIRPDA